MIIALQYDFYRYGIFRPKMCPFTSVQNLKTLNKLLPQNLAQNSRGLRFEIYFLAHPNVHRLRSIKVCAPL